MSDLIDRKQLLSIFHDKAFDKANTDIPYRELKWAIKVIKQAPSAEKTGKWIDGWRSGFDGTRYWYRACSECGYERDDDDAEKDTNYCPNCGARMAE